MAVASEGPARRIGLTNAMEAWPEILAAHGHRKPLVFLDFDGTLAPIVDHPEQAVLPEPVRAALGALSRVTPVAIISGRGLDDVRRRIGIDGLWFAGSHGFDVAGPNGERFVPDAAEGSLDALAGSEADLVHRLAGIDGTTLERKRFSLAVHYRNVEETQVQEVVNAAEEVAAERGLRVSSGRMVADLQPDLDWHKGRALTYLRAQLAPDTGEGLAPVPIYLGDDVTDEDAFEAIVDDGVGIVVVHAETRDLPTWARYAVDDPGQIVDVLHRLTTWAR